LTSGSVFADDRCKEDPRVCFNGFEDDGTIIPKDPKVKRTFSIPPIKAGFVVDLHHRDILPHISIELLDFTLPYAGDFALDVGVATSRVMFVFVWEVIPIVKIGPSVWAGYNVRENAPAFGLGFSVLDF